MVETMRYTGKPVAEFLRDNIKERIARLNEAGITPHMEIIRVGAREDDVFYERSIIKNCTQLGISTEVKELPSDVTLEGLKEVIEIANDNKEVHGIMLFRPLPKHLDEDYITRIINPDKDIDCMSPVNLEKIFKGHSDGYAPCTPKAVVEMLKYYQV